VVLEIVVRPGAPVAAGAAVLVSAAVFAANRRALNLAGTFPEVARLPIVGKWLGGGR
jgi:hypothetical protein